MTRCLYCGGEARSGGREEETIACPGCGATMGKEEEEGVVLDGCGACGGTWYDRGELEIAIRRAREAGAEPPRGANERPDGVVTFTLEQTKPVYRACPRCSQPMARRNYGRLSGVVIDVCAPHGAFLDRDELERIAAFAESGGVEASRRLAAEEAERRAEQAKKMAEAQERMMATRSAYYPHARRRWFGPSIWRELLSDLFD